MGRLSDRVKTSDAPVGSCSPHAGVPTRVPDPPLALGREPGSLMSGERGRGEGRGKGGGKEGIFAKRN